MSKDEQAGKQDAGKSGDHDDQSADQQAAEKHVSRESWNALLSEKKKEQEERRKLQAKLDKIDADKKAADEAKLKEDGKLQELVQSKDKDIAAKTERIRRSELKLAAQRAGLIDMDYIDVLMKSVQFDENDQPVESEALFAGLKEKKPFLFAQPSMQQPPGTLNRGAAWGGGKVFTKSEVESMDTATLDKNWSEIERQDALGLIK